LKNTTFGNAKEVNDCFFVLIYFMIKFFQTNSFLTEEIARLRDEAVHLRDEVEHYRSSYNNELGEAGQVRDELKKCEIRVRELQNEV